MSAARAPFAARFGRLHGLLEKGMSFEDAVNRIVGDDVERPRLDTVVLRRASLLGSLDRALYETVVRDGSASPTFEDAIRSQSLFPESTTSERWRVPDGIRVDCLRQWLEAEGDSARERMREIMASACRCMRESDDPANASRNDDGSRRLRLELIGMPQEATPEFERRFGAADDRFDLAGCHALVQLLQELEVFSAGGQSAILKLLTPEQRMLHEQLAPYVAARGRFLEEYVKSADYLEREWLHDRCEGFLESDAEWLLPIYGPGGLGKTMFIRWLIARRCLPRAAQIPVGKLDFDDVNTVELVKFPWLVLQPLAEQLNRQLPWAPFTEYLDRLGDYAPLLLPASRLPPGIDLDGLERSLDGASWMATLAQDFAFKLGSNRVVIILDTLEEPVLHFPGALGAVLRLFREIRATLSDRSRLKLVLCGRYDLRERGHLQPGDSAPVALEPFTPPEARVYLGERRRMPAALVEAAVEKAAGNPFILSLIADLVDERDVRDVAGVRALRPEYAYLIKRVIERIPHSQAIVRWVVRYGVVPRRLTREFLEVVMWPHLLRETDEQARHLDQISEYGTSFPRGGGAPEPAGVWAALRGYSDSVGWLRGDEFELRFQPEVVKPMRALLAVEDVYRKMNRDAITWFESRASQNGVASLVWAMNMAESFSHRLQLEQPDLEAWLESALDSTHASNVEARATLLDPIVTLLSSPTDIPISRDGSPLISPGRLATLHYELARQYANVSWEAFTPTSRPDAVRRLLQAAVELQPDAAKPEFDIVRMAVCSAERNHEETLKYATLVQGALHTLPALERYAYHLLKGRALASFRDAAARQAYEEARALLRQRGEPAWDLMLECASQFISIGCPLEASVVIAELSEPSIGVPPSILVGAAEQLLRMDMRPRARVLANAALERLRSASMPGEGEGWRARRIAAICDIEEGQLESALRELAILRTTALRSPYQAAQLDELDGLLAAGKFELDAACALLQKAARGYASAGDQDSADRALQRAVFASKDLRGDLNGAAALVLRTSAASSTADWLHIEQSHLRYLLGELQSAPAARSGADPDAEDFMALLTTTDRSHDPARVDNILRKLSAMEPPAARWRSLDWFRWLPMLDVDPAQEAAFLAVVPAPNPEDEDYFPRVFGSIEMLRCLRSRLAVPLVEEAFHVALSRGAAFEEHLVECALRTGAPLPEPSGLETRWPAAAGDALTMATHIAWADALFQRDDPAAVPLTRGLPESLPESLLGSRFEAMMLVNRSKALEDGEDRPRVDELIGQAASVWRALGHEPVAQRLLAQSRAGVRDVSWKPGNVVRVELRAVPSPLNSLDMSDSAETASFQLANLLSSDRERLVRSMQQSLWNSTAVAPAVEFTIDQCTTAALPWEWALPQSSICFRSSRNLPLGPSRLWAEMVWRQMPQRARRIGTYFLPLRVALLRPSTAHQQRARRGIELRSTRSMAEILRGHGIEVTEPSAPSLAAVADLLRGERAPHMLYIQAPIVDRRGQLAIDLPFGDSSAAAEMLDVDFWSHSTRLAEHRLPVILIAPPRPSDDVEVARQLLLRNAFATQLAQRAKVRAVIGAGLFPPGQAELCAERVAFTLAGNPPLQEILMMLRRELPGDHFCTSGATLFASNPQASLK